MRAIITFNKLSVVSNKTSLSVAYLSSINCLLLAWIFVWLLNNILFNFYHKCWDRPSLPSSQSRTSPPRSSSRPSLSTSRRTTLSRDLLGSTSSRPAQVHLHQCRKRTRPSEWRLALLQSGLTRTQNLPASPLRSETALTCLRRTEEGKMQILVPRARKH